MRLVARLALMLLAFVASAATVIPIAILVMVLSGEPMLSGEVMVEYAIVAFVLVAVLAFFPAVLVVAIAEWKRIRGWRYFTAAGGLTALLLMVLLGFLDGGPSLVVAGLLLLGGLAAGMVYWLIAGRSSGALRDAWAARGIT